MIQDEEIREFQEIVGSFHPYSEDEQVIIQDKSNKETVVNNSEKNLKIPNVMILLISSLFGILFFFSILIGTVLYVYPREDTEVKVINRNPIQNLKIPGIEKLITDPFPEGPETKIKVWGVGTAVPPESIIFDYEKIYERPEDYFDEDELKFYKFDDC